MAYMNQQKKQTIKPGVDKVLKKYGLKGSLSVDNHSTLVLTIKSGGIDFFEDVVKANPDKTIYRKHMQVNEFWIHEHFTGKSMKALMEIKTAMNLGNHDRSDAQSDYFDVGWYININVGRWDKPYELVK